MRTDIERRIEPYLFPIEEVSVFNNRTGQSDATQLSKGYKAIVRKDTQKLIAIQRDSYRLIPNKAVIAPLLEQLQKLDVPWYVDSSHSFVDDARMRIQITFPSTVINDGRSDIALSMYLQNSYDSTTSVRLYWGGLRSICQNGLVSGIVLGRFLGKHTQNFSLPNLHRELDSIAGKLPALKHRISVLQDSKVTPDLRMDVERHLGKHVSKYVAEQERETHRAANQWALFNIITYYVSHLVKQRMRTHYQLQASKIFQI